MLTAMYRKGLAALIGMMFTVGTYAQQSIHIQSEAGQPFSITMNGTLYTSSSNGYLIIPQADHGSHTLLLNLPGNEWPGYSFTCEVGDAPLGFSLKQSIDNSWSLFDMVTFATAKGMLAPRSPVVAEPIAQAAPKPDVHKDTSASQIRKIFDKASAGGIDQVYVVTNGSKTDTVALFIPELEEIKPKQTAFQPVEHAADRSPGDEMVVAVISQSRPGNRYSIQTHAPVLH